MSNPEIVEEIASQEEIADQKNILNGIYSISREGLKEMDGNTEVCNLFKEIYSRPYLDKFGPEKMIRRAQNKGDGSQAYRNFISKYSNLKGIQDIDLRQRCCRAWNELHRPKNWEKLSYQWVYNALS